MEDLLKQYVNNENHGLSLNVLEEAISKVPKNELANCIGRIRSSLNETSITKAALRNNLDLLKCLLEPLKPHERYALLDKSAIHGAAENGHDELIAYVLHSVHPEHREDLLNLKNSGKFTPLHHAVQNNRKNTVGRMLYSLPENKRCAVLSNETMSKSTPVHFASGQSQPDIMGCILSSVQTQSQRQLLLGKHGGGGCLPIDIAVRLGCFKTLKCMLNWMSRGYLYKLMKIKRPIGTPTLHYAAVRGHKETVKLLLEPLTPNQRYELIAMSGQLGTTALHVAANHGNFEALMCMVDLVAPDNQRRLLTKPDGNNETVLDIALARNSSSAAVLIQRWFPAVQARWGEQEGMHKLKLC